MKISIILSILFLLCSFHISAQDSVKSPEVNISESRSDIKNERTPQLEKLYALVRSADRIVVTQGSEGEKKVLFDSSEKTDLEAFVLALNLVVAEEWRSSICADPTVTLYKDGKKIGYIGDVSGREVKTSVWDGNTVIADQEKWLRWFDDRNMPMVRKERDHAVESEKKNAEDEARWYAAMPKGIKESVEEQRYRLYGLSSPKLNKSVLSILEKEYPEKSERIFALLNWFGSGAGPWSGYPSYESIAEDYLLLFTTQDILAALNDRKPDASHLEGASRLFAGWKYSKFRAKELDLIPKKMRKILLDQALKSGDEDKIELAKAAFSR